MGTLSQIPTGSLPLISLTQSVVEFSPNSSTEVVTPNHSNALVSAESTLDERISLLASKLQERQDEQAVRITALEEDKRRGEGAIRQLILKVISLTDDKEAGLMRISSLEEKIREKEKQEIEERNRNLSLIEHLKEINTDIATRLGNFFKKPKFAQYCTESLPLLTKQQIEDLIQIIKTHTPCTSNTFQRCISSSECGESEYGESYTVVKVEREIGLAILKELLHNHLAGEHNSLSQFPGITDAKIKTLLYNYINFGREWGPSSSTMRLGARG